jgi:hypothetical protein
MSKDIHMITEEEARVSAFVDNIAKKEEEEVIDYREEDVLRVPLDDYAHYLYTFDLGVSAALVTAGFELVWIDKSNPRKVQFIFKKKKGIGQALDEYWSNKLRVKARSLNDNTKMLKNRLYSD